MKTHLLSFSLVEGAKERIKEMAAENDSVFNQAELYNHLGEATARLFYTLAKDVNERSEQDHEFLKNIGDELSRSVKAAGEDGHPVFFRFV